METTADRTFSSTNLLEWGNTRQLSGVVYSDASGSYLISLPGESLSDYIEVIAMEDGDWLKLLQQTDLLETEVLAKAKDGSVVKAILRKCNRQIDQSVSWKVFRRDNYSCRYCGKDDVPLTVDHLVLWEEGGPSTPENLLSACKKCNKTRGNMQYAVWLQSEYYQKASRGLDEGTKLANGYLVSKLDAIPRKLHVASR